MTRRLIPAMLALAFAASPAAAAHKYLPPLTGLVPPDFVLAESTAPWLPEQLAQKSLAVVVSGNLDVTIAEWRRDNAKAHPDTPQAAIARATDPAAFVRRLIAQMRPKFATMTVVPDIATARRQNADYIAVLDFDTNSRSQMLKSWQVFHGGVTMLDGKVARVFTVEADSEARSSNPLVFNLDSGSVSAEDTIAAFTRMSDEVATGLDARLR